VQFEDGSSRWYANPDPFKTNPGANSLNMVIAPQSSIDATPVVINSLGAPTTEAARAEQKKYLFTFANWTHVRVNTSLFTDTYVYNGGLCNEYGVWYPGAVGDGDPVNDYIAAHPPANPNADPKPNPVSGEPTVVVGTGNPADGLNAGGPVVQTKSIDLGNAGGIAQAVQYARATGYAGTGYRADGSMDPAIIGYLAGQGFQVYYNGSRLA
jgi:hypothetical protein